MHVIQEASTKILTPIPVSTSKDGPKKSSSGDHPYNEGFAATQRAEGLLCRPGCDEIAHSCRESGLNDAPAA